MDDFSAAILLDLGTLELGQHPTPPLNQTKGTKSWSWSWTLLRGKPLLLLFFS